MWISSEDARSDFILAAAAVFLGVQLVSLLAELPIYPLSGPIYLVLSLVWVGLLACGAPLWLARYRGDVPAAFGLQHRGGVGPGLVLAAPLLVGHVLETIFTGDVGTVLLSLAGRFTLATPTIGEFRLSFEIIVLMIATVLLAVGSWLTGSFLAVRAREAFRSPDADLTELLRTFGMGGVAVSLVLGLLVTLRDNGQYGDALMLSGALLVVVLLADQYVPPRVTTVRTMLVAPAIAVLVLWVIAFGGPFRGDLLRGLYSGVSAAVLVMVAAAMIETRRGMAAAILLAASAIYPIGGQIMQPLPLQLLIP